MKSTYIGIFVFILIVIGLIVLSTRSKEEPVPEPVVEVPTQTTTNEVPTTASDHTMPAEEHATTMGTDVGMEMPVPDMPHTAEMMVDQTAKVFNVSGVNYAFDITEIKVKEGDTVTINFKSADGFHDLVIDEFNARTSKVQTDGTTSVTFVADKKGTFEFYCSVGKHRMHGMVGKFIVE